MNQDSENTDPENTDSENSTEDCDSGSLPESFQYARGKFARRCKSCRGTACQLRIQGHLRECANCDGMGYFGINPELPTICPPGTEERMVVIRIREAMFLETVVDGDATLDGFYKPESEFTPVRSLGNGSMAVNTRSEMKGRDREDSTINSRAAQFRHLLGEFAEEFVASGHFDYE